MHVLEARLSWGGTVVAVERIAEGASLVVGEAEDAAFHLALPSLPGPRHALARVSSQGAFVDLPPGFVARVDGEARHAPFALSPDEKARVPVGALEIELSLKRPEPRIAVPLSRALDLLYTRVLALFLVVEATVAAALWITPQLPKGDEPLFENAPRFVAVTERPRSPRAAPPSPRALQERAREAPGERVASTRGLPPGDPRREKGARAAAEDALAALGLSSLQGASLGGGLLDGARALAGLKGPAPVGGPGNGDGGLAHRGLPGGGGGDVLGIGGLGGGGDGGDGGGVNLCSAGGCRKKGGAVVVARPLVTKGGLAREEIQRVMGRALKQVRFCYERGLQRTPDLEGKIAVYFVISPSGEVATAQAAASSLDDDEVDACVLRVVRRLTFPAPRGGGEVVVTYPFVFSSAGAR